MRTLLGAELKYYFRLSHCLSRYVPYLAPLTWRELLLYLGHDVYLDALIFVNERVVLEAKTYAYATLRHYSVTILLV